MSTTSTATPYLPTLRWHSHLWRFGLCLLVSSSAWSGALRGQWSDHRTLFWIDLGVGLAGFGLCLLRRRWPYRIALLLAAFTAVSAFATGPAFLAAVSFASQRRARRIVVLGTVLVVAALTYTHTQPVRTGGGFTVATVNSSGQNHDVIESTTSFPADLGENLFLVSVVLGWGLYIGSRRELLWTLRQTAENAQAEQEFRVSAARAGERARIAREMHDVVAHRITQVSMQAGAMTFREDLDAPALRAGVRQIQTHANLALTELSGMLGVLRDPENGELQVRPQPTHSDLAALVAETIESGMHIDFEDLTGDGTLPEAAGRTVFRIVQEGITNARKHAPNALLHIRLTAAPTDGIDVRLSNAVSFAGTPAAPGSGLGLIGLAERTALAGGRLEHRREAATFVLHGWIPWAT